MCDRSVSEVCTDDAGGNQDAFNCDVRFSKRYRSYPWRDDCVNNMEHKHDFAWQLSPDEEGNNYEMCECGSIRSHGKIYDSEGELEKTQ